MDNLKLLHTFTFRDNFGWSFPEVQEEAFNAATRRSEMMGWTDISVQPVAVAPEIEGSVRKYRFEIWGIGEALLEGGLAEQIQKTSDSEAYRKVSREADI